MNESHTPRDAAVTRAPGARRTLIAVAVATAVVAGAVHLTTPVPTAHAANAAPAAALQPIAPKGFADVVEAVRPAVVNIAATGGKGHPGMNVPDFKLPPGSPFEEFFNRFLQERGGHTSPSESMPLRAAGSGFIVDADGHVVTNNHVVDGAREITVVMQDGTRYPATLKGTDPKTDLALLKIEADKPLPHLRFGDSDSARAGDWVLAIGNPFGLGGSVTTGIISARGRDIDAGPFDDYIQVDAPINRGNSGGPLFNTRGDVIGVNTAIFSPNGGNVGIGFAIPSDLAEPIVAQLKASGKVERGWLGVKIQPVTAEVAKALGMDEERGALVASVEPDSPAAGAGVRPGDVIVGFAGEPVDRFKQLPRLVARAPAGSEQSVEVWRAGESHTLTARIGGQPGAVKVADNTTAPAEGQRRIGVSLTGLTDEARRQYSVPGELEGVLVADVEPGSPAAKRGLKTGDVIVMVGQTPVKTPDDVVAQVRQAAEGERPTVLLLVNRAGDQRYVAVGFPA